MLSLPSCLRINRLTRSFFGMCVCALSVMTGMSPAQAVPVTIDYEWNLKVGEMFLGDFQEVERWTDPDPIPALEPGNYYYEYTRYLHPTTAIEVKFNMNITYDPDKGERIVLRKISHETTTRTWPTLFKDKWIYGTRWVTDPDVSQWCPLCSTEPYQVKYWMVDQNASEVFDFTPEGSWVDTYMPFVIPEPPTLLIFAVGLAGLACLRKNKN